MRLKLDDEIKVVKATALLALVEDLDCPVLEQQARRALVFEEPLFREAIRRAKIYRYMQNGATAADAVNKAKGR